MFSPIFVAKTKIIYGYNFRAPLTIFAKSSILDAQLGSEYASVIPQLMRVNPFQRPSLVTCSEALNLL